MSEGRRHRCAPGFSAVSLVTAERSLNPSRLPHVPRLLRHCSHLLCMLLGLQGFSICLLGALLDILCEKGEEGPSLAVRVSVHRVILHSTRVSSRLHVCMLGTQGMHFPQQRLTLPA